MLSNGALFVTLNRQSMSFNPMGSSTVGKLRNVPLLSGFQPPEADPRSVAPVASLLACWAAP